MDQTPSRPDIYAYLDYRPFLADLYAHLKRRQRRFSLRNLRVARDDGQGDYYSAQFLNLVIKGDKPLPATMIPGLAKALGLSEREAQFLERLAEYTLADSPEAKAVAFDRLAWRSEFRDRHGIGSRKRLSFITNGYIGDIYLMTALPDFQADPAWIAARLLVPVSVNDVADALQILQELQLISIDANGCVERRSGNRPQPGLNEDVLFRLYHREQCDKAKQAVEQLPASARAFHTWGVSRFSAEQFQCFVTEFEAAVGQTLASLVKKYEARDGEPGDVVAQINLQIFPVNRAGTTEGGRS